MSIKIQGSSGNIADVDGSGNVKTIGSLPTGAATSANQTTEISSLSSIDSKTPTLGQATSSASTPVVLPASQITTLTPPAAITGFATSVKQDTGNTSLSSIDGKITTVNTGAVTISTALPTGTNTVGKVDQGVGGVSAWKIDGSAVTQPVSGTITANQGGIWTVQPGNTANTTAWKVDGSSVTQPVSAISLPLPSNAAIETGGHLASIDSKLGSTLIIQLLPSTQATYIASSAAFTPGATPQDIFTITGSASKTINILKMGISTIQGTAGINSWFIVKRSTANTGGTSVGETEITLDSNDIAATATVLHYTANPTAGTLVGNLWSGKIPAPTSATSGVGSIVQEIDFTEIFGKPLTLRGTSQVVGWNFGGAALPTGLSVHCFITWTEF